MKNHRSINQLGMFGLVLAAAFAGFTMMGSGHSEAAEPKTNPESTAQSEAAKHDKDGYTVELKAKGEAKAGKESSLEIVIEAKGPYHINSKYPLKFKVTDPAPSGVSFAKSVLKREDGKFDDTKGSLPVAFTAASAGKVKIAGVLSLSVCSDSRCVMDKVELALDVDVK